MKKENNKIENNEKSNSNSLKRSSYSLIVVASITLFMMLVFFSYSLFGGGKGTYSSMEAEGSCYLNTNTHKYEWLIGYPDGPYFESKPNISVSDCNGCESGYSLNSSNIFFIISLL